MKQIICLFAIIQLLSSCGMFSKNYQLVSGKAPTSDSDGCSELYSKIQEMWRMHKSVHCYHYKKALVEEIMTNKQCFVGLDTSAIISLFGKPNRNELNTVEYNLSKDCQSGDDYLADYLLRFYIDFNKNPNVISSMTFGKVQVLYQNQ